MEDHYRPNLETIAAHCQKGMADLLEAVTADDCCVKDFVHGRDIQLMQERYSQWAGNLGALQHFKSSLSLTHRLRDAPLVRDSILNTLTELHVSLQDGKNAPISSSASSRYLATGIATGGRQNRVSGPLFINSDIDISGFGVSPSDSDA